MSHLPLEKLKFVGTMGLQLNRRIDTHLKERAQFDKGAFKASPFPPNRNSKTPEMELISRELFLRRDIVAALTMAKADPTAHLAAIEQLVSRYATLHAEHLMKAIPCQPQPR